MGYKAFIQLLLIIIAVVIIVTYIQPTFADIRQTQNEMFEYTEAVSKANEFNALLQSLVAKERSFSQQDRMALDKFLPTTVDEIKVMSDLENIADQAGVQFQSVAASELGTTQSVVVEGGIDKKQPVFSFQDFQFSMKANYADMKNFLRRLEANAYVFEIYNMTFSSVEEGEDDNANLSGLNNNAQPEYDVSFVLRVYAQELPADVTSR